MSRLPDYPFELSYEPGGDLLHDFYLPALERSKLYRRKAGFFSSTALAVAAQGVARLIRNDGHMQLLCGARLTSADVESIREGSDLTTVVEQAMLGGLEAGAVDDAMERRLEILAWLVSKGHLEIRVVLPKGPDGRPLPVQESQDYYHPKEAVFQDAAGNRLAFTGSVNETATGWLKNYETFTVFTSWERRFGDDVVGAAGYYIAPIEHRFERLWEGKETDWIALDIPTAARDRLLEYCPDKEPSQDPLERPAKSHPKPKLDEPAPTVSSADRLVFQFLREAPFLPEATRLGVETSAVRPWPHQDRVVDAAVDRYPQSFLFCDEVGLGKTIEAGLAYRQLRISGRVRRSLLLVPASLLRQWQEELYEKCALNVPRYDAGTLVDVFGRELDRASSPWEVPHLLASSQLVKRRDRQDEVLAAGPWDLVLVDEAHHARRKDFAQDRFRPNRLLELLLGTAGHPGLKDRARCLYLLTATPMQVHPIEVWDLLRVTGMGGRWGAAEGNFLDFFEQLRRRDGDRDWDFLIDMLEDYLATGGTLDKEFASVAEQRLGPVEWDMVRSLTESGKRTAVIRQLSDAGRGVLEELLRRHTPLRSFMWRNTRNLLRAYREKGILTERVPDRDPVNEWIELEDEERELYDRIEEYISDFYQKYEAERKGLGFVMTVYRRRLTSSFYAIERSLERRLEFLQGSLDPRQLFTDEDLEEAELDLDITETLPEEDRRAFLAEVEYVEDFLRDLRLLATDSKLEFLKEQLRDLFRQRDTVILFTQYTDTMDYLRDQVRGVYGHQVACYSGRGGEIWDGVAWVRRGKEELKEEFRKGETIKLLLCTESASEGLNLQTCGILINFDMPWNPMRVEQRIGRIDRIGQKFEEVWIRNYFYKETVEAQVYQRLSDRIDWFESVVGELQPILHRVGRAIRELAMMGKSERQQRLDREIAEIRRELDEAKTRALNLDEFLDGSLDRRSESVSPVKLADLERELAQESSLASRFAPHPELDGVYVLDWKDDSIDVTFRPELFDLHPYTVRFLTYGDPLFEELLTFVREPPPSDSSTGVAFLRHRGETPTSLFLAKRDGAVAPIANLTGYETALENPVAWTVEERQRALEFYGEARRETVGTLSRVEAQRLEGERRALLEQARRILVRTALLYRALAERPDLFSQEEGFFSGVESVRRLGDRGVPYRGLLAIMGSEELDAGPTDPYSLEIQGRSEAVLRGNLQALKQSGLQVLQRYSAVSREQHAFARTGPYPEPEELWLAGTGGRERRESLILP